MANINSVVKNNLVYSNISDIILCFYEDLSNQLQSPNKNEELIDYIKFQIKAFEGYRDSIMKKHRGY